MIVDGEIRYSRVIVIVCEDCGCDCYVSDTRKPKAFEIVNVKTGEVIKRICENCDKENN